MNSKNINSVCVRVCVYVCVCVFVQVPGQLLGDPEQWPRASMTGGQMSLSPWKMTPGGSWEQTPQCQRKGLMIHEKTKSQNLVSN